MKNEIANQLRQTLELMPYHSDRSKMILAIDEIERLQGIIDDPCTVIIPVKIIQTAVAYLDLIGEDDPILNHGAAKIDAIGAAEKLDGILDKKFASSI
jgi:hypothetical protein